MARQRHSGKASQEAQDDLRPRQPAWREQAPARPRKRVKRKQATVQDASGKTSERERPRFRAPSREMIYTGLRVGALLLTAIAVTAGLIYLLTWPELAVSPTSTLIGGYQRIAPADIYTGSKVDGRNVLLLRTDEIAAEVKKIPGVAKADVHVRLPNQVIIDIREHAPLVAWQAVTGTLWLAADGAQVPQAGAAPPLTFTDRSSGRLAKDAPLRKLVLDNLAVVHAARPSLTEFAYGDEAGLYYRAPEGWEVWLGESGPMDAKLAVAEATGQDLTRKGERTKAIDVRESDRKAILW